MTLMLDEIAWGEPLFPIVHDADWEAQIRLRGGQVSQCDLRLTPCAWLREAALGVTTYSPVAMPRRLYTIGAMVTAQENACRYCYGANRAMLRLMGYSEAVIHRIERDLQVAQLDARDRAVLAFCRSLARSRPRPSRRDAEALIQQGMSRAAVHEGAFAIAMGCFYNRVSTLLACPPEQEFERLAAGPLARVFGLLMPAMQWWQQRARPPQEPPLDAQALAQSRFAPVLLPLAGLPGARVLQRALDGAFAPSALSPATKALMFAVVARTLDCGVCETQALAQLSSEVLPPALAEQALARLHSDRVPAAEVPLLAWSRDTVHYETGAIQRATRALRGGLSDAALLEAVGVAALANAVVRLAMLQE